MLLFSMMDFKICIRNLNFHSWHLENNRCVFVQNGVAVLSRGSQTRCEQVLLTLGGRKGGNMALLGLIHGGKRKNSNSQAGRYVNGADPAQSPSSLPELVPTLCYWGIKLGNAQEFYWENQACI